MFSIDELNKLDMAGLTRLAKYLSIAVDEKTEKEDLAKSIFAKFSDPMPYYGFGNDDPNPLIVEPQKYSVRVQRIMDSRKREGIEGEL